MRPADLASVARLILSAECKNVCILTGAGVSVAAGIPDFRSPGGMYMTLKPELITATAAQRAAMAADPVSVVLREMFFANPFPYLEVRRPFILGTREQKWRATLSHRFAELLHERTGKLARLYTQNIDGLDYQCAIPNDKIVPVHGSIGRVACEGCGAETDFGAFCDSVSANIKDLYGIDEAAPKESTPIPCARCNRPLVKPTTVLFGSNLPDSFFERSREDMPVCDLLIVAGTSLVVSPANSLVYRANPEAPRLVINNEPVGEDLGLDYGEGGGGPQRTARGKRWPTLFAQGDCDDVFLELMLALGWHADLSALVEKLPEASAQRVRRALGGDSGGNPAGVPADEQPSML